jgi:uncharacterized protein (UPF0147 family)
MPQRTLSFEEFGEVLERLGAVAGSSVAIGVTDAETGRLARLLEFGSIAGQRPWPRPGPRTVFAVDPETGSQVVVSAQAPQGFIRVHAARIRDRLREELAQPADWLDAVALDAHLARSVRAAARKAIEILRAAAPQHSGRLRESLTVLNE